METSFVFAQYSTNINNVIKQTFVTTQRIKLTCFDASPNYLMFGATSGGTYIFKRNPCEFFQLVPSKEGSSSLIAISPNEQYIGIASSKGLILIIENSGENFNVHYQVFREHEANQITYLKWIRNELYVGDNSGKVSVISVENSLFQAKSLFQIPAATLMILDSAIVQIDAFQCYLLVSTKTKTYLCNTEKENFIQIGQKLRDGIFGACFSNINNGLNEYQPCRSNRNAFQVFQSLKENEIISDENLNGKIYCARPGARLWQCGFNAKVLFTYQFKNSLSKKSSYPLLLIGCEEESGLEKTIFENNPICEHFNFKKIYSICDNFIVTYDTNKLYIFEPTSNELLFHMEFSNTIQDIAFVKNNIYVWKNDLEIVHIAVVELESLILATLYNKQYHLCMDICLEFISKVLQLLETSKQLHLISVLNNKLSNQKAATKMQPIFDKIKEMNQKESTHTLLKRNIVLVENLHMNKEIEIPSIKFEQEDPEKDLQIILKQYKLNKTHRTIDIPEVQHLLDTFTGDEMFLKFKAFQEYVTTNLNEDATEWCRLQYLKNISIRDISATTLSSEAKDYLTEAVIKENEPYRFSCECGYPTPKCYKYPPTYFNTALDVLHIAKDELKILRAVPYLWQYALKFNVQGPRLAVLIQYGELEFFKDYTLLLPYDQWHDIVGYYIKIRNKGVCVNCDNKIDLEDLISWTDLAKIIVESIGARNTIRLLKNYSLFIPKGSLDPNFYQTCIFANSVVNEYRPCREKSGLIFQFLNNLDSSNQDKLQDKIAKYFTHKHVASKKGYYMKSSRESGECGMCKLPLDNDILLDCLPSTNCKHKFHKFCLEQSDNTSRNCNLC